MSADMTIKNDNHYEPQHVHAIVNQMRANPAITPFPASFPSVDAYVPVYASGNLADNKYWRLCDIRRR